MIENNLFENENILLKLHFGRFKILRIEHIFIIFKLLSELESKRNYI